MSLRAILAVELENQGTTSPVSLSSVQVVRGEAVLDGGGIDKLLDVAAAEIEAIDPAVVVATFSDVDYSLIGT